MYSLWTQSKQQKLSQLGFSGKQVSSHFILYKSKPTPGLGLRTMPLELGCFPSLCSMQMQWPHHRIQGCLLRHAFELCVFALASLVRQQKKKKSVKCDCKVSPPELIMADKLSEKTSAGWRGQRGGMAAARLTRQRRRECQPEELELCPSSYTRHLSGFSAIVL